MRRYSLRKKGFHRDEADAAKERPLRNSLQVLSAEILRASLSDALRMTAPFFPQTG
jgi:hypothetical protein